MAKDQPAIDPKSKADFDAAISEFAKQVKVDRDIIANEQMRLMLRDAMTFTPPMPKGGGRGLTASAHKAGMNKLGNDVRRIFVPADSPKKGMPVLLRQVINSVRANDQEGFRAIYDHKSTLARVRTLSPVMRKIMEDTSYTRAFAKAQNYLSKANIFGQIRPLAGTTDDPRPIHDKYKNAVGGRWKRNQAVGGPQYFIPTVQQLEAYIAERQLKVGRVKAGWATALQLIPPLVTSKGSARNYGVYNAPWVDANRSSMGQFSMTKNAKAISMTATNLIGNINNVSNEAGTENLVYGNRVKQMRAAILARLEKSVKQANNRKNT
jgi:hypothetical protein